MTQKKSNVQNTKSENAKYKWMLLYFLIGSGIPLMLFLIEFHNTHYYSIDKPESFLKNVIIIYSPLFLYACVAGFMLPYYIVPAYQLFKSAIIEKRIHRIRKRFIAASVIVALVIAFSDFFGGASAIWEVKPPLKQNLIDIFMKADSITSIQHPETKYLYQKTIDSTLNKNISNWSLTRYSYFFSIVIEGFFLNAFFYLCIFYYGFRRSLKKKSQIDYNKNLNGLIISSLIIFIWLLLRDMNGNEKMWLYPGKDLQVANIGIGVLNIGCLLLLIISSMANSKMQKVSEAVIGLAVSITIFIGSVLGYNNPKIIVQFFGRQASLLSYLVFPVVFLLLFGAYYIINMGAEYEKDLMINTELDKNDEE